MGDSFKGMHEQADAVDAARRRAVAYAQQRISFFRRGADVRRYHTHRTIMEDTVGHHSANVGMFVIMLWQARCAEGDGAHLRLGPMLAAALAHDLPEHTFGDIPAPAKRKLRERGVDLDTEETVLLDANRFGFKLTDEEHRLLKLGDYLDGLSFCVEERMRGNRYLNDVAHTYRTYLRELAQDRSAGEKIIINAVLENWEKADA